MSSGGSNAMGGATVDQSILQLSYNQQIQMLCNQEAFEKLKKIVLSGISITGTVVSLSAFEKTIKVLAQYVQEGQPGVVSEQTVDNNLAAVTWVLVNTLSVAKLKVIGQGGQSEVWQGITVTGEECVIKTGKADNLQRTATYLHRLASSRHVIDLLGVDLQSNPPMLLESLCSFDCEDLYDAVYISRNEISMHVFKHNRAQINRGLLEALSDIHEQAIIHTDIKRDNILLTKDFEVKISDFGLAIDEGSFVPGGSCQYMAPEQIDYFNDVVLRDVPRYPLSNKIDVWQMMIVIVTLNQGFLSPPFQARIQEHMSKLQQFEEAAEAQVEEWVQENLNDGTYQTREEMDKACHLHVGKMAWYAESVTAYMIELKAKRLRENVNAEGLFSDLKHPHMSLLEELLVDMSYFNPDRRKSSKQIMQLIQSHPVE